MKVIFREENPAAIFSDERVRVGQLTAGIVQLQAGAAREPDGRNAAVVQGGSQFVEARYAFSVGRNQAVHRDVKNKGSLLQEVLRRSRIYLSGDYDGAPKVCKKSLGRGPSEKRKLWP